MKKELGIVINLFFLVFGFTENIHEKSANLDFVETARKINSQNCQLNETCVRFCCDDKSSCLDRNFFNMSLVGEAKNLDLDYKILTQRPNCISMFEEEGSWKFLEDGKVVQFSDDEEFINDHNQYCFDRKDGESRMLICHEEEEEEDDSKVEIPSEESYPICNKFSISTFLRNSFNVFILTGMLISVPFLVATFFIYSFIRELRKLHGKAVMCFIFALILVYVSLALIRLNNDKMFKIKWLCKTASYFAYLSILTCFFWLNVMSYDIWSTFR
jgi:7 transmembrane receptor (Secretin family)